MGDHANSFQHLVTFIQDEIFDTSNTEIFISDKTVKSSGSSDDDVRTGILILDTFDVFQNGCSAVENSRSNIRHVFSESGIFIPNLKCQFTGVT